ncbi:MAG: mechanosensitive ion channel [Tissierellia bacterium]|nr:mechanosensitive ion channel [Bacillota bacterium]NLL22329.1 mechanosensitive ion channel [Tissierellia bacterium]
MDKLLQSPLWVSLLQDGTNLLKNIMIAILVYVVGNYAVKKFLLFFRNRLKKRQVDETAIGFIYSLLGAGLKILVVVIALAALQVPMASITALIGAAGLSVGLALQGSLSNLAGGIILVLFQPFKVGDYVISVEAEGSVQKIDLLTTSLVTPDNKLVLVPNAHISSRTLVNVTAFPQRRVEIGVCLQEDSDPEAAREVLIRVAGVQPQTLSDRPIDVVFSQNNDASLSMTLRFWVNTEDYWQTYWRTLEDVKKTLRAEGIRYFVPSMRLKAEGAQDEA